MQEQLPACLQPVIFDRNRTGDSGRRIFAALVAMASIQGCSSGQQVRPTTDTPHLRILADRGSTSRATVALTAITNKYATCRTYRDHGTVVVRTWGSDGLFSISTYRFDTLFIRERGLRFRYLEEDGRMTFAMWALSDHAEAWSNGVVDSFSVSDSSVIDAMAAARGVTSLTSWFVPHLLYGRAAQSMNEPWYAGSSACPECPEVAFFRPSLRLTSLLSLDLRTVAVRRYYSERSLSTGGKAADSASASELNGGLTVTVPGEKRPDLAKVETLILYDLPEFDVDDSILARELEKRPW